MYGVSIGGNGLPIDQIEPIERRRLFAGLAYTTLRNRRDFSALESLGKPIDVFPDMVWATPRFYPSSRVASRERTRIGFNLFMRGGKARRVLEILIGQLVRIRSDWEFVFIDVNPNDVRQGGSLDLSSPERKNCRKVVLHELHAASELLGSLTFLVTNKLHVGVVAMSLGVPVVSYAGEPKTQLLFDDVGLNELCWRRNQLIQRFASCFFLPGGMTRLTRIFARLDIEAIVAGAMNHFAALTEIVDFHASNRTGVWTRPRK
jgi:polysaccharide pyruvyl transferase WcaK-like protein